MKRNTLVWSVTCVMVLGGVDPSAHAADVGTAFTFQGRLENDSPPVPVTDTCDFRFGLWNALVGGAQVGTNPQTPPPVSVDAGLFTVSLDFGVNAFTGDARWLEMEVRCPLNPAFILMTPRVELTPAPYSLRAMNGVGPPGSLQVEAGTGDIGIGTTSPNSALHINGDGVSPSFRVQVTGSSKLIVAANGGVSVGALDDTPPAGGLYVSGDVGIGTSDPTGKLHVVDATGGDASVVLPTGAISAIEISDEPGVASNIDDTADSILTTPSVSSLLSHSITVPGSGFVLAIGTLEAQGDAGPDPATRFCRFAVSSSNLSFPTTQRVEVWGDNNDPVAVTVHGMFSVTAGAHTFYLLGQEQNGAWTANFMRLSLLYFPTSFGTVAGATSDSAALGAARNEDTNFGEAIEIVTAPTLDSNASALEREIAELKKRLAAIEERLLTSENNEPGGER